MTNERRDMLYSFDYWRRCQRRKERVSDAIHLGMGVVIVLLVVGLL